MPSHCPYLIFKELKSSCFGYCPVHLIWPTLQDTEASVKGKFDAVLDTIGVPETERIGINVLRRGGHYMTLQVINLHFVFFALLFSLSHVFLSYFPAM
jgi:hypothetical protein